MNDTARAWIDLVLSCLDHQIAAALLVTRMDKAEQDILLSAMSVAMAMAVQAKGEADAAEVSKIPDTYTVQNCCICYGGNSFPGPMKEALLCHGEILQSRLRALAADIPPPPDKVMRTHAVDNAMAWIDREFQKLGSPGILAKLCLRSPAEFMELVLPVFGAAVAEAVKAKGRSMVEELRRHGYHAAAEKMERDEQRFRGSSR